MMPLGNKPDTGMAAFAGSPQAGVGQTAVGIEELVDAAPASSRPLPAPPGMPNASQQISEHVRNSASFEALCTAIAATLQQRSGVEFTGWYSTATRKIGQTSTINGLTKPFDSLSVSAQQAIQSAISQLQTSGSVEQTTTLNNVICVPVRHAEGILIACISGAKGNGRFQITSPVFHDVQFAAAGLTQWILESRCQQSESEVRNVAAIIDLVSRISNCAAPEDAYQKITEDLRDYFQASDVYLGICDSEATDVRLAAISGTEVDKFSDVTQTAEAVLQESIAREAAAIWPAIDSSNRHALLSHQRFATTNNVAAMAACPLRNENGDATGAIFVTFDNCDTAQSRLSTLSFLTAAEKPIATALHSLKRSTEGTLSKLRQGLKRTVKSNRLRNIAISVAAVVGIMCIPVDYRVSCDTELQPVSRRFVAAPFEAPLEECLVEPGDVVEVDQVIARLDGRELRWELAGVRADIGKATKEHNAFLSERKSGDAAIARHEIERLQNKAAVLEERAHNLEIRSPIAGMVVAGDLKDTEGVPLETGQSLFEIAPLNHMVIEVAVPEDDIRHVQTDMTVQLRLDAMPSESVDASILRIHPQAELRDHENVFIAEAELENAEQNLRPGMRGSAKVSTGSRMLGWTLLHKPLAHTAGWLGW